jgi:nucleoside-diphosphate-sugar epimerase
MKIFVTGGTGFIGSHFLNAAHAAGHEVVALRRSPDSKPRVALEREPFWVEKGMAEVIPGDLSGSDVLVHLAARGVSPQVATWEELLAANVLESFHLWNVAAETGVRRFVICGSAVEYGRASERYEFIPPDAPLEPTTGYGASKAAASMAALAFARERHLEMALLRPFQAYGEGQHEANFWPALKAAALAGRDFPMTSGGQVRDFVPVEQVVRLFLEAATEMPLPAGEPRVCNVGSGRPQTLATFAEFWWKHWAATGRLLTGAVPYRPGEIMRCVPLI